MSPNLLRNFQIRAFTVHMPMRIKSYVVRKDDWYTIIINEALSPEAQKKAYFHEVWHIENGDFDSQLSTSLLEICAHEQERR